MNTELEKAIHIATQLAEEYQHESFGPAHLVKASLNRDLSLLRFLHDKGVDVYFMEEWADVNLESYPKRTSRTMDIRASSEAKTVFIEAEDIQTKLNRPEVDLVCLFISAITPGVGFSFDQLKSLPVSSSELLASLSTGKKAGSATKTNVVSGTDFTSDADVLKKYTQDLLVEASQGYYDHIVNRDRELKQIAEIISRKSKPNVMIQGESGVGKTVLDIVDDEGLMQNAAKMGAMLMSDLKNMSEAHDIIGDVRGMGLFVGVELVTDRATKAPATEQCNYVLNRMREERILMGREGPDDNILKIRPPLSVDAEGIEMLLDRLHAVLCETGSRP